MLSDRLPIPFNILDQIHLADLNLCLIHNNIIINGHVIGHTSRWEHPFEHKHLFIKHLYILGIIVDQPKCHLLPEAFLLNLLLAHLIG